MKTTKLAAPAAMAMTILTACGGPVESGADDLEFGTTTSKIVPPEATWGASHDCWRAPENQCISETKMLMDYCDNRNPGPTVCSVDVEEPYRHVGRLDNGCTGTLVTGRMVLTAAHCVVNPDGSRKIEGSLGFSLGQIKKCSDGGCPYGTRYAKRIYVPTRYGTTPDIPREHKKTFDVALVELNNSIASAPLLQLPGEVDVAFTWGDIYSLGYPGDKVGAEEHTVWNVKGETHGLEAFPPGVQLFLTDIDGHGGQSGSPVYIRQGGLRKIIGVLVGSPEANCNAGDVWVTRLTRWIYDNFLGKVILGLASPEVSTIDVPTIPADDLGECEAEPGLDLPPPGGR